MYHHKNGTHCLPVWYFEVWQCNSIVKGWVVCGTVYKDLGSIVKVGDGLNQVYTGTMSHYGHQAVYTGNVFVTN